MRLWNKKATMITTISLAGTNLHENLVWQVKFFTKLLLSRRKISAIVLGDNFMR